MFRNRAPSPQSPEREEIEGQGQQSDTVSRSLIPVLKRRSNRLAASGTGAPQETQPLPSRRRTRRPQSNPPASSSSSARPLEQSQGHTFEPDTTVQDTTLLANTTSQQSTSTNTQATNMPAGTGSTGTGNTGGAAGAPGGGGAGGAGGAANPQQNVGGGGGNTGSTGRSNFKIPDTWDKAKPTFDESAPETIEDYLGECQTVIDRGGITDEQEKKKTYVKYLKNTSTRDAWMALESYTDNTKTAEDFTKEILGYFPEVIKRKEGTIAALNRLCKENKGISMEEEGALRRFGLNFKSLYSKLTTNPPVITNKEACDKYIAALNGSFRGAIRKSLATTHIVEEKLKAYNPGQQGANQPAVRKARKEDPVTLQELIEMAETMASSTRASESDDDSDKEPSKRVKFEYVKEEPMSEKVGDLENTISGLKDTVSLLQKENQLSQSKLDEIVRAFQQAKAAPPPRPPSPYPENRYNGGSNQQYANRENSYRGNYNQAGNQNGAKSAGSGDCRYCGGSGHWSRECLVKEDHIKKGLVSVLEGGQHRLGDGNWIPSGEGFQSERVENYWKKKNAKSVNFHGISSDYQSQNRNRSDDYMNNYPEEAIDEIRSLKFQLANSRENRDPPRNEVAGYMASRVQAQPISPEVAFTNQFLQNAVGNAVTGILNQAFSNHANPQTQEQFLNTRSGKDTNREDPQGF